ncbi:hypothetical protein GGX14DRAFT_406643 [Mycena pura]|uniref:Uncharacterized protein n=1 Tax=Mycena pura TaxID=153505 RepID=A0AAD6Y1D7_9AGAR|nr:hypothetical protein GGX14DRAFT_406643 [Mycena pura]
MPCSSLWERGRVIGDKRESIGRQSSLARPVRDRARAKGRMQRRASGSRDCRRSSGHMKTGRQTEHTILGNIEVQLVSIATPAAEKLNFEISVTRNGSRGSGATPETVTRVARLIETDGSKAGFEGVDKLRTVKGRGVGFSKERSGGREGMYGEQVLHGANWAGGWRIWHGSDDNGDTTAERVGLGGGDSYLHILDAALLEKPNGVSGEIDGSVKPGAISNGEFTASEEPRPGHILRCFENSIVNIREIASDETETEVDVKCNGELGLAGPVSLKTLDAPNHALQRGGVTRVERKA